MWKLLFDMPERILCEQASDVKENDKHALVFALHLSHLFSVSVNLDFPIQIPM
jgi:hypothetical protein